MEGGGNEGMGEGRPKTVDVIAMPAVVATTCSRKMTPVHEGGGILPPLPLPTMMTAGQIFWQQLIDVNINAPAMAEPG